MMRTLHAEAKREGKVLVLAYLLGPPQQNTPRLTMGYSAVGLWWREAGAQGANKGREPHRIHLGMSVNRMTPLF